MKNISNTAARILLALALCAMVSACSQPLPSSSFPAYGSHNVSTATALTIMDY